MTLQAKSLDTPEEVRTFGHGHTDMVGLDDATVARAVFEPGWKWSHDVKPIAGTDSCQAHHVGYVVAGHMHIEMKDGSKTDLSPGDAVDISPGHDAWVLGDESCVMIDWGPATSTYAKAGS